MRWDKGIGYYVKAASIIKNKYNDVEFNLLGSIDENDNFSIPKNKILEWQQQGIIN